MTVYLRRFTGLGLKLICLLSFITVALNNGKDCKFQTNSMMLTRIIIIFLSLSKEFLVCKATCHMYIHSKAYQKLFWHATNDSTVILSKSSRTLWAVHVPVLGKITGSLSIEVLEGSGKHLKGLYLDVDKSPSVILKRVNHDEIPPFWTLRKDNGLIIQTQATGIFKDVLFIQEPLIWLNDYVDIHLTDDVTQKGVRWMGDVVKGCAGIFGKKELQSEDSKIIHQNKMQHEMRRKGIKVTEVVSTFKEINITKEVTYVTIDKTRSLIGNSTVREFHSENEYREEKNIICFDESLRVVDCKVSAGTDAELKGILDKAYVTVSRENTTSQVMNFVERVDNIALNIAKNLGIGEEKNINSKEYDLKVKNQPFPFVFPSVKSTEKIVVKTDDSLNMKKTKNAKSYTMVGILYKSIHNNMKDDVSLENNSEKYHINSKLISASVVEDVPVRRVIVELPLTVKLEDENKKTVCAFWNTTGRNGGFWSTNGCKRLFSTANSSTITCECNHLTNFALLTATVNYEVPYMHRKILDKLSLVCCCVSLVSLFVGIIILLLLTCRTKKHTRYTLHLNLMIALFISQLLFVTGIDATKNRVACKSIAYLLHYFLLASFMWMLLEGLYLYFLMVKVFTDRKTKFNLYMIFAWGLPAILVTISGVSSNESYGTQDYCWLSNQDFAVWAFLGPVLSIIVVNMIILFMIIHQILILSKRDSVTHDVKMGLRSSLILLPILGVGWVTGMLSVNLETIVFQYIFAITNGLQGFMITLFHCILNGEVRKGLRRLYEVWIHSSHIGQHFQHGSGNNSRINREDASWSLTRTAEDALNRNTTKSSSTKFIESSWDDKTNDFRVDPVVDDE